MAAAAFWDVCELKMIVFDCLREDRCDASLASCARVHSTWTDSALDALWFGFPGIECDWRRTRAIASLPRDRRQVYASRIDVLDLTDFEGILAHTMFNKLEFPRLKEVILTHEGDRGPTDPRDLRLAKYLQPSLRSLKLTERNHKRNEVGPKWLTTSLLSDIAQKCPNLEEVLFWIESPTIEPADLALLFRSIRPRVVELDFTLDNGLGRQMLTGGVLSASSHGGRLERLDCLGELGVSEEVRVAQLQSFLNVSSKPFPCLTRLHLHLQAEAVPLLPRCFPAVTWLRLVIYSTSRDELALKALGNMPQLQFLDIQGDEGQGEFSLSARAFIHLGSLTQLRSLEIATSFFPCCMSEDNSEEPEFFNPRHKFTRADASTMFSKLTALEHLSISIGPGYPDHLFDSISEHCPDLSSIELRGELDPWHLIQAYAPILGNVRQMTLEDIKAGMSPSQVARLIDNFAPKLEQLSFREAEPDTAQIYTAWDEFRTTQRFFKDANGTRIYVEDFY